MNWYLEGFRKYADFAGRARRREYWMFSVYNAIVTFALIWTDSQLQIMVGDYGLLTVLYSLVAFLPSVAVAARRLHDTGRSGWWIFISVVPGLGSLLLLAFLAQDSQRGENDYGPNPKQYAW